MTAITINQIRAHISDMPHIVLGGKAGSYRVTNMFTEQSATVRTGQYGHSVEKGAELIENVASINQMRDLLPATITALQTEEKAAMQALQVLGRMLSEQAMTSSSHSLHLTIDAITRQNRALSRARGKLDAAWQLHEQFKTYNQIVARSTF